MQGPERHEEEAGSLGCNLGVDERRTQKTKPEARLRTDTEGLGCLAEAWNLTVEPGTTRSEERSKATRAAPRGLASRGGGLFLAGAR